MRTTEPRARRTGPRAAAVAAVVAAAAVAAAGAIAAAVLARYGRVNWDAGYYLGIADSIRDGLAPFRDVRTEYPPGASYLFAAAFAVFGRSYGAALGLLYAVHLANAFCLYRIIRGGHVRGAVAAGLASFHLLTVLVLFEGGMIELEPFQVLFALVAVLVLRRKGPVAAAGAGLAVGASLMMKQYSVLFVPPLAIHAAFRGGWRPCGMRVRDAAFFCAGVPIPFLVFCAVARVSPTLALAEIAGFGGVGLSYGFVSPDLLAAGIAEIGAAAPMLAALAAVAAVAAARGERGSRLLFALGACGLVPLAVRHFPHYFQLSVPFVVAATAPMVDPPGAGGPGSARRRITAAAVAAMLAVPTFAYAARMLRRTVRQDARAAARAMAARVEPLLEGRVDTVTVGAPEQMFLLDIRPPPELGYVFVNAYLDALDLSPVRQAVVFPPETGRADAVLRQTGLEPAARTDDGRIVVYRRSPGK